MPMCGRPARRTSQGTGVPGPPKPCHKNFPLIGPSRRLPFLSNMANDVLTHCTNCVFPTAPLVSGGAFSIWKLGKLLPSPSFGAPIVAGCGEPGVDCKAPSGDRPSDTGIAGFNRTGFSVGGPRLTGAVGICIWSSRIEVSLFRGLRTSTCPACGGTLNELMGD